MTAVEKPLTMRGGIGKIARAAIRAGKTNQEALDEVKAMFPKAKTSIASMNWYRNQERMMDKTVPTAREVNRKRKEDDDMDFLN